jgi:hypothetical protein
MIDVASKAGSLLLMLAALINPSLALAQTTEATPAPAEAASPAPAAVDMSKLTPAQQEALQEAIIKLSQNPVGNIAVIPFQSNFNYALGPYARFQYNLNIQPVVPFMLSDKMNLIARTIIPILVEPSFAPPTVCATAGCGSTFGISDVQEQLFFAPKTKPGALIWGAGPIFQFPFAQPQFLGSGKWSAGPALVGLIEPGHFVMGILMTQLWSFAGKANNPPVDSGLFQPFINYNMKHGWSLSTGPIITVDYTAPGNQKWAVPIGGGGGKTFKLGDQPMQVNVLYYTFIQKPLNSPQTNLRIVWSLLYPIKRGLDIQQILKENP